MLRPIHGAGKSNARIDKRIAEKSQVDLYAMPLIAKLDKPVGRGNNAAKRVYRFARALIIEKIMRDRPWEDKDRLDQARKVLNERLRLSTERGRAVSV